MLTAADIKSHALGLGFDLCGIAPAMAFPELSHLREWLDRGRAGEMFYLRNSAETRSDIRNFLPTARSVIVMGTVYATADPAEPARASDAHGANDAPPAEHDGRGVPTATATARIARYARGADYHVVLAERLDALVTWMRQEHGEPFDAAIFVDKHHVQERVFARHAGIGWVGKNTCVINPDIGSWIFLSGVAVSLALAPDAPVADHCGACTLCLDSCPTGALVDAYELDATRCISYLTIELKHEIPEAQRASIADHVFGCDICQDVCPWNLAPLATLDPAWQPRPGRTSSTAAELWERSDAELHAIVEGSAMTRRSIARLRRNLAVVLGNSGDAAAADVLDRPGGGVRRAAPSADTPLVREHVAWAKRQLAR
jgi:epoxyqueuosine reductase